jgi:hypothetical protein
MKALSRALAAGLFAFSSLGAQPCEHADDALHVVTSATAGMGTRAGGVHAGHGAASAAEDEDLPVADCCDESESEAPPCPPSCACPAHASGAAVADATLRGASVSLGGSPAEPPPTPQSWWARSLDTPPPRD